MSNLQDFLEMKKYYLDVIKEKDQRIAELEQDLVELATNMFCEKTRFEKECM